MSRGLTKKPLNYLPDDLRDLKSQIEALGAGDGGVASGSHGNRPMYELYAKTETAKFSHLSKVDTHTHLYTLTLSHTLAVE